MEDFLFVFLSFHLLLIDIPIRYLVKSFKLGAHELPHRTGLEFVDYFDIFPMEHVQQEIEYLHKLTEDERNERIGNIVIRYNLTDNEMMCFLSGFPNIENAGWRCGL